jgi:hypothetical protein
LWCCAGCVTSSPGRDGARGLATKRGLATAAVPFAGMLVAVGLVISRRPDAVTHAQFWAEDGKLYYANVYNHGLLRTLLVPQSGYFQTLPVLAAALSRLVSLAQAPLVMNVIGIFVQALPVGLLLSSRAAPIAADIRVRVLLAALYIGLPHAAEIDANAVNAQWHLAVAAVIVLMLSAPARRWGRALDGAILLASGLTGPFCLILAPLAWLQRRRRGPAVVPTWEVALLVACAALQAAALLVISKHPPAGYNAALPANHGLAAVPALFAKLVGGRVLLGPIIGQSSGLTAPLGVLWPATVLGLTALLLLAWRGPAELRIFIAFAAILLALALLRPDSSLPLWPALAVGPEAAGRYFFIPQLAVLAALVWLAVEPRLPALRIGAAVLLTASLVLTFPSGWRYPSLRPTGFRQAAAVFAAAPVGTTLTFPLNPGTGIWRMTLTKR